ncbi:MAG: DUF1232 domain-containing protein [Moorea sp. SIO4E2]|uniref:YkvA family protein n=1 Tax=Moorena sp. SIO4E2 TaxID=2607826 RepID=UPI0013B9109E|nr:YkvA family protein [Moorena sp. SIO4E2]NEQ12229.1 DUF1232 domain-containing protein [Moorena sp. SIO4E2]
MNNPIQSFYNWYRNTIRHSKYRWWIILGTLVYFLSPIDISPDFIPILGQIDDIAVITLLVSELSQWLIDFAKNRQSEKIANDTQDPEVKTVDVDSIGV